MLHHLAQGFELMAVLGAAVLQVGAPPVENLESGSILLEGSLIGCDIVGKPVLLPPEP